MSTVQTKRTFADLFSAPDDKLYELVRGELVEKQMGFLSLWVATEIAYLIRAYAGAGKLGWVTTELPIDCFPWLANHGRRPDVAYFAKATLPTATPTQDPVRVAPDLVVEVLSPNDDAIALDTKIDEYLKAGVKLVWIVNPQNKTVRIHRADGTLARLAADDAISGESVLPGFTAQVAAFFPSAE
jgi:Uma2 family endonuclease